MTGNLGHYKRPASTRLRRRPKLRSSLLRRSSLSGEKRAMRLDVGELTLHEGCRAAEDAFTPARPTALVRPSNRQPRHPARAAQRRSGGWLVASVSWCASGVHRLVEEEDAVVGAAHRPRADLP